MKSTIQKLKFLLLLSLIPIAFSCGSDDGGSEENNSSQTFLESLDGTKWKYVQDGFNSYYRFNDNLITPFEYWFDWNEDGIDCYYFWNVTEDPFDIVTNSENALTIFFDYGIASETFSFTNSGNKLKVDVITNDGGNVQTSSALFNSSTDNLDGLQLCDE